MTNRRQKQKVVQSPAGLEFLEALYSPLPEGLIEVRALSPSERPVQLWFEEASTAYENALSFDRTRNVFFGVAKRKRAGGSKADVLGATALWFDLDSVNLGWDTDKCIETLSALNELAPSAVIRSGGGVHGYYFLAEPEMHSGRAEEWNAVVRDAVCGDNVQNIDRILRMPGTWNAKRGRPCEVAWCGGHRRFDPVKLVEALKVRGSVFSGDAFPRKSPAVSVGRTATTLVPYSRLSSASLDELWGVRVKYQGASGGTVGVDEAIMLTTAKLHCLGWRDERVISETLRRVRQLHATQARDEQWDWDAEREGIRKKLDRWKTKWPNLKKSA